MNKRTGKRANSAPFSEVWLRADLSELIDSLSLTERRKHFLRSRWLESLLWMESAAQRSRRRYYALRLVIVVGAVTIPALVSINAVGKTNSVVTWVTFAISLVVGVSAAVDGFFHFGDRWRHYRSIVEEMKTEGWDLHELSGVYAGDGTTHGALFPVFVKRVDTVLVRETQTYIAEIAAAPQAKSTSDS